MTSLSRLKIPQKLFLAFAGLIGLAVIFSGIGVAQLRQVQAAARLKAHTLDVIEAASEVRAAMVDQQTGLRGYMEGRRAEFLQPFEQGRATVAHAVAALRQLTRDNPGQQMRLDGLERQIDRWHRDYADLRLAAARAGAAPEDLALALQGKKLMDGIKQAIADIVAEERRLLAIRENAEMRAFAIGYWAVGLGGFTLFAFATGVWALLRRDLVLPLRGLTERMLRLAEDDIDTPPEYRDRSDEVGSMARALEVFRHNAVVRLELQAERVEAAARIRRSEEHLRGIFDSVREGILTCGSDGRVEAANEAAARLFGCQDPVGRDIGDLLADPDDPDQPLNALEWQERHGVDTFETAARTADGAAIPVEASLTRAASGALTLSLRNISARKEVDRLKTEFVSTVSHELRTPLTSIRGALGLVLGIGSSLPEKQLSLLQIAHRNAERLIALVNDILDIEKIQSGKMFFSFERAELNDQVEEALLANETFAGQRNVRLRFIPWMDAVPVNLDRQRMQQVLANLLSNAIKYSMDGGTVTVRLRLRRDGAAEVSVHDTGPGVPAEFRGRIFQKFAQADSADTRAKGGTGLGLSITKAIVERHGGTVGFDSEPGDTTFFFTVPTVKDIPDPPAFASLQDCAAVPGARLLICEDDLDIARLLRYMVQRHGVAADIVHTAAAARESLERGCYTAMTLDLGLPDQPGLEMFRSLRDDPRFHDLPIVVISATAMQGAEELNGDAVGIVDWLEKPIDEERLARALGQVVRRGDLRPAILYVEDDADLVVLVERMLAEAATVTGAPDLAAARLLLSENRFDLVILDLGLGHDNGLELLPYVANLSPPPPVLIFSAQQVGPDLSDRIAGALVKSKTTNEELARRILDVLRPSVPPTVPSPQPQQEM